MYLLVGLQGQAASACPGANGAPTEWMHGTQRPSPSTSSAPCPMRVMIRMLTAT